MEPKNRCNYSLFFVIIVILAEGIFFFFGSNKWESVLNARNTEIGEIKLMFDATNIEARAVSVYDYTLKEKIYGKNDDKIMPIASLAKIMSVAIALTENTEIIPISASSIKEYGDYGFYSGEKFKLEDLARFTLVVSANDGAYALTENIPNVLKKMNDKAKKIGVKSTRFLNTTGLDLNEFSPGSFASAEDMNIISWYALHSFPEIFSATAQRKITVTSENGFFHNASNTNPLVEKISGLRFSKTGYTPLAGGNLSVIYTNNYGREIAVTVLGSTFEGRFSDMENIIATLYNLNYGSGD